MWAAQGPGGAYLWRRALSTKQKAGSSVPAASTPCLSTVAAAPEVSCPLTFSLGPFVETDTTWRHRAVSTSIGCPHCSGTHSIGCPPGGVQEPRLPASGAHEHRWAHPNWYMLAPMSDHPTTVEAFCLRILEGGDLASKLVAPRQLDGSRLDDVPGKPILIDAPSRNPQLRLRSNTGPLPKLRELAQRDARVETLSRFAHHELMAVELFAWALLRWPDLPSPLRRGFLQALAEEQAHLRLYIDRMQAHGCAFGDVPLSDHFWNHADAIAEKGPLGFLSAMGLTFEQANLDFSLLYRDAFRNAGDEESATVCQQVHDDEIRHVALAITWVRKLKDPSETDEDAYKRTVPFPLSAARAKGRRFEVGPRRRAGLDDAFIDFVRRARPYEREP